MNTSTTTASPEILRLLKEWEQADPRPSQALMRALSDRRALVADAMRADLTSTGHGRGAVRLIHGYVQRGDRSISQQRLSVIIRKAANVRADVARLSAALVGGCLSRADHEAEARHLALALDLPYVPGPDDLPGWTRDGHEWNAPSGTVYTVHDHDPSRAYRVASHVRIVVVTSRIFESPVDVCYTVE